MRKLFLLIVSVCYLASTSGVAVQWHYCMGKLRSVDIGLASHSETCDKCGMAKKKNHCCKDEVNVSKVTDSHQQTDQFTYSFLGSVAILPNRILLPEPYTASILPECNHKAHAPPDITISRTILFQVFRC